MLHHGAPARTRCVRRPAVEVCILETMLVGRGREIAGLEQLLASAAAGRGGLRVVHGEPGIGKTRLADEIAARAATSGFTVSWGRAWETGGAPAYWPWIELLGVLAEGAEGERPVPPKVGELLGRVARPALGEGTRADPARERFEVFEAVGSFLRACARGGPLLLVFDDLHMADGATLELLSFVARGLRASRIAVVATWRDAEARAAKVAEVLARIAREGEGVPLRPLSSEDVAEVVRHEVGHLDAPLAARLYELTEGNPLFLFETIHTVAADAGGATFEALREVAVAGVVQSLVRTRLSGASAELKETLEVAATFGREVTVALLAEVLATPVDVVQARLAEATTRGLLLSRGEGRWAFSHVLVREAFYRELAPDRARAIHGRIAASLATRVDKGAAALLPTLAHHALEALPDGDTVAAMRTACLAAERARAQLAYEEAIALLERALGAGDAFGAPDAARVEVLLALGWASTEGGRLERGRDVFRAAAATARRIGDARLFARAALGQGGEYVLAEIRTELVDVLREALALLGPSEDVDDVRLRARILARLAAALTPSATPDEPLDLARRALEMAAGETDTRTRLDVDVGVGAAYADFAPPRERVPVNERLLRDARALGDRVLELRALTRLACDHIERGDVASAEAVIATRGRLAEAIAHPRYMWQTPLMRSMRAMPDGRFAECETLIAEARGIAAEAADPNAERCIEMHRFSMLLVAGRPDELKRQETATVRTLSSLPDGAMVAAWASAAVAVRVGERARAITALELLGTDSVMSSRMSRVTLADTAVLGDVREVAAAILPTIAPDEDANSCWGPFAFSCGPPIARVQAAIAFMLGHNDEGVRHATRALALSGRMGAAAHLAWVHLTWGEGTRERAHLDEALARAETLGMPEVAARARAAMERSSSAPPRSVPPPRDVTAFTMKKDGDHWAFERGALAYRIKDVRGLGMIARLVECRGREVHALDLASDPEAGRAVDLGDAGEILDPKAREAYKARIQDLREEIEEADGFGDPTRASRLREELEALTQQIAGAVGLGGRERRAGSAAERARITVQRRVREAIKKIAEHDAELGQHLDWTIRTGTFCAYEPDGKKKP